MVEWLSGLVACGGMTVSGARWAVSGGRCPPLRTCTKTEHIQFSDSILFIIVIILGPMIWVDEE